MKRVAVNSKTTSEAHPVGDDQLRHQTLLQDHLDLQKEVVTKKKLQAAKQRRANLLAEIRFLRRRHRHLLKLKCAETEQEGVNMKLPTHNLKGIQGKGKMMPVKLFQVSTTKWWRKEKNLFKSP